MKRTRKVLVLALLLLVALGGIAVRAILAGQPALATSALAQMPAGVAVDAAAGRVFVPTFSSLGPLGRQISVL